jgi:hypothetical protein
MTSISESRPRAAEVLTEEGEGAKVGLEFVCCARGVCRWKPSIELEPVGIAAARRSELGCTVVGLFDLEKVSRNIDKKDTAAVEEQRINDFTHSGCDIASAFTKRSGLNSA